MDHGDLSLSPWARARERWNRDFKQSRKFSYLRASYGDETDYGSLMIDTDDHLTDLVAEAECLTDIRGDDYLQRYLSEHLSTFETAPKTAQEAERRIMVPATRVDQERINQELAGLYPVKERERTTGVLDSDQLKIGQTWVSKRQKHTGLTVRITSLTERAANVKVIAGGINMNPRKVVGAKWHIGKEELLTHYARQDDSRSVNETTIATLLMTTPQKPQTEREKIFSKPFNVEEQLTLAVNFLKRWGQPVKSYVLTQHVSKALNAERTKQVIDLGVQRGLIETWHTPVKDRPKQSTQWVGLPGCEHIATEFPPAQRAPAKSVQEIIDRQYNELSDQQRDEIAKLAAEGESTVDIQRAYNVLGGVVGRIKREKGLSTTRHDQARQRKAAQAVEPQEEVAEEFDDFERALREAPPASPDKPTPVVTPVPQPITPPTDHTTFPVQTHLFMVKVLRLQPVEETLEFTAPDLGEAWRLAQAKQGVVDVLSVAKIASQG